MSRRRLHSGERWVHDQDGKYQDLRLLHLESDRAFYCIVKERIKYE